MIPIGLLAVLMAHLHTPLPDDAKEPWKLQATLTGVKIVGHIVCTCKLMYFKFNMGRWI